MHSDREYCYYKDMTKSDDSDTDDHAHHCLANVRSLTHTRILPMAHNCRDNEYRYYNSPGLIKCVNKAYVDAGDQCPVCFDKHALTCYFAGSCSVQSSLPTNMENDWPSW
jgi:hypothetical protein